MKLKEAIDDGILTLDEEVFYEDDTIDDYKDIINKQDKEIKRLKEVILKIKIKQLSSELPLLCDEDYYNACDLIEQLELELQKLKDSDKE